MSARTIRHVSAPQHASAPACTSAHLHKPVCHVSVPHQCKTATRQRARARTTHFVYSCTARATTRSLFENGIDDTTKTSLKEVASAKIGFALVLNYT